LPRHCARLPTPARKAPAAVKPIEIASRLAFIAHFYRNADTAEAEARRRERRRRTVRPAASVRIELQREGGEAEEKRRRALAPEASQAALPAPGHSFFLRAQVLYYRVPAQAGYGDKWPPQ
jgi:hypothetical protein